MPNRPTDSNAVTRAVFKAKIPFLLTAFPPRTTEELAVVLENAAVSFLLRKEKGFLLSTNFTVHGVRAINGAADALLEMKQTERERINRSGEEERQNFMVTVKCLAVDMPVGHRPLALTFGNFTTVKCVAMSSVMWFNLGTVEHFQARLLYDPL